MFLQDSSFSQLKRVKNRMTIIMLEVCGPYGCVKLRWAEKLGDQLPINYCFAFHTIFQISPSIDKGNRKPKLGHSDLGYLSYEQTAHHTVTDYIIKDKKEDN